MSSSVFFQVQSFIIVALMLYGVSQRKIRFKHMRIMKIVIAWDLLLVAQIELTRQAINTASKAMTNPWFLNFHISLAVSTVLLYFCLLYTGTRLNKGDESIRKWHKPLGLTTVVFRLATLVTSLIIEVP
ncbi:MAG: hypothetical protein CME65_01500 [Halobacteriovoraceae bacterium]|nr:hypothetical protein [Halobacteriovoraceae bacterium]|tara:strand:+ start:6157 stop:6543 length:387 start_codon:yes stop_codon:yes gene_type:complete